MGDKNNSEIVIALAGNPNAGKTCIFNALTGEHQHVGNWPGVTVEKKEGRCKLGNQEVRIVDLPGIYSLSASSLDEKIARDFLVRERPSFVVVVLDSSNLERNLYLAVQLMEMEFPIILDLNMLDLARSSGLEIDKETLAKVIGVPVVGTVGKTGEGIERLKAAMGTMIAYPRPPKYPKFYGEKIERGIQELAEFLKEKGIPCLGPYPNRWSAIKILEKDEEILALLHRCKAEREVLKKAHEIARRIEETTGYDAETALIARRYAWIHGVMKECCRRKASLEERINLSQSIDRITTHRFWGLPIFLAIMWLTFRLTFDVGGAISGVLDSLFGRLGELAALAVVSLHGPAWLASLIQDGIIGGVGSVLVFLPNIAFLFLAIGIMEETGYMARGAFVMDRFTHAMGLHGKSFIPMVMGFGCNVPAIMATRTLENPKDRIITILINPLMSCSARLPIYVLFAGAFFAHHEGTVIFSLYLLGVVLAILLARLFKSLFFKGESAPLVMELPPYHLPTAKAVLSTTWHRSFLFVKKAGTVIFAAVVVIWMLAHLPPGVAYASKESLMGKIGSFIAPALKPAGFGYWQVAVALVFGILAKEIVVGTLGTLYGAEDQSLSTAISHHFTPLSAYAFMVMSLVYIPCIATIGVIRRETNSWRWTALAVGYSLFLGWFLAVLIYQGGKLLGLG